MSDSSSRDKDNAHEGNSGKPVSEPTIVGGRPLARNRSLQGIPRGIEILIKKASVDPEFRSVLLEKRGEAAAEIDLELSATEAAILNAIPAAQIEKIIENAKVPDEHRRIFLGKVAAAMLGVLGLGLSGYNSGKDTKAAGIEDILPPKRLVQEGRVTGIRPDRRVTSIAKTPSDREVLRVSLSEKATNTVDVVVGYECPFDNGEITISFWKNANTSESQIEYQPSKISVSKGKGEVTFRAVGAFAETRWLQVRLYSDSAKCRDARTWKWHPSTLKDLPGEYAIGNCLIFHIVEYRKVWSAE